MPDLTAWVKMIKMRCGARACVLMSGIVDTSDVKVPEEVLDVMSPRLRGPPGFASGAPPEPKAAPQSEVRKDLSRARPGEPVVVLQEEHARDAPR